MIHNLNREKKPIELGHKIDIPAINVIFLYYYMLYHKLIRKKEDTLSVEII